MDFYFRRWSLQLVLFTAVVGSAIVIGNNTQAQVVPDNTLGSENSAVTNTGNIETISGGATRGANLFHSFEQFSVQNGRIAYFDNGADIQNIITRVTGGSISTIDGILGAGGTANLFLLNPNGIVFGQNASLFIGGSFIGTTASSINFADGTRFSATPGTGEPLLTVSVPIGLQFGTGAGNIVSRASTVGLQVEPGRTLGLVGGNVSLDGGFLIARNGRVDIGGVSETATIGLNSDGNNFSLSFPQNIAKADVSFTNGVIVSAFGSSGSIAVNARNIEMLGDSTLLAGIDDEEIPGGQAGDITLNASDRIALAEDSDVFNSVLSGVGNAGNISIQTDSLSVTDSGIYSITSGQGNAGNVSIRANGSVVLDGSSIFSNVGSEGVGRGGNIDIQAGSFSLGNSSYVSTSPSGQGDAGNVFVQTSDNLSIAGSSIFSGRGSNFSDNPQAGVGRGGDIAIEAGSLSLNDALIGADTSGQGDAGNISIEVNSSISADDSLIFTDVFSDAVGKGGDISIQAESLSLSGLSAVNSSTAGQGDAGSISMELDRSVSLNDSSIRSGVEPQAVGNGGNIDIQAESFSLSNSSRITTASLAQGNAGNIRLQAQDAINLSDTRLQSNVGDLEGTPATGNVGNIFITAETLSLTDAAQIQALFYTNTQGNPGIVSIQARDSITIAGIQEDFPSGIFTSSLSGAVGNGSDLEISAPSVTIADGAVLEAVSSGQGNAGNIQITANSLTMTEASASVESQATGAAGNLEISARDYLRLDNVILAATTAAGDRGNINVRSRFLGMRRGSQITTNASGDASGGNINIDTDVLIAAPTENSDIIANAVRGRGGNINIDAQAIFGIQQRPQLSPDNDITASSESGVDGTVQLNSPEVDPSRDVVELPTVPVDASALVAAGCPSGTENRFTVTGRGGLPPAPGDNLSSNALLTDWATLRTSKSSEAVEATTLEAVNTTPTPLVEATTWQFSSKGEIVLTADTSNTPNNFGATPTSCSGS